MSMYLIKTTEQYRCDSEEEAKNFIEEQKKSTQYEMTKYSSELRQVKMKGEVVDEYYRVQIVKNFDSEKDPIGDLKYVSYSARKDNDED